MNSFDVSENNLQSHMVLLSLESIVSEDIVNFQLFPPKKILTVA
jgi:hypothetical protein